MNGKLVFGKMLTVGLSFMATMALGFSAQADDGCLNSAIINQIEAKISIATSDISSFNICQPGTNSYKILQALSLIQTIQFDPSALGKPFNQGILPNDFWTYMSTRTRQVVDEPSCGTGILAYVYGGLNDGIVHICPALYKDEVTVFERAETILHEARHFEGYAHVTCNRGPRNGKAGACDNTVEEVGSYAVTVETLTKMATSMKNLPSTTRTMIKVLALTYANEVFNEPIRARDLSAFYLVSADQRGFIYSDLGVVQVPNLGGDRLISRGVALAVFPKNKTDAYTVNVFSPLFEKSPAMGSFSAEYNSMPIAQRPQVIDIMNLGYLTASITSNQVKATLGEEADKTIVDLPWAISAVYSGKEVGQSDSDSLYLVDQGNAMYRLQFVPGGKYNLAPMANPLGSLTQLSIFNGARMALDANGILLTETNRSWAAFRQLSQMRFTQVTRPFLWDQYFEDQNDIGIELK